MKEMVVGTGVVANTSGLGGWLHLIAQNISSRKELGPCLLN